VLYLVQCNLADPSSRYCFVLSAFDQKPGVGGQPRGRSFLSVLSDSTIIGDGCEGCEGDRREIPSQGKSTTRTINVGMNLLAR